MIYLDRKPWKSRRKIVKPYYRPITRWYRPPEVTLLQSKPSTLMASDVWRIGAIFAELLQMQRKNVPDPTKRGTNYLVHIYK